MLENTPRLSDDETDSELYLDAEGNEASKEKTITEYEKDEPHEFQSCLCIWDHNFTPFQFGVYSQFLEARMVLNNNLPKCDRTCRYPERKNLHVKKIEETVLTCHIAHSPEKRRCPICCRLTDQCICGKDFDQPNPDSWSCKKHICSICTPQAKYTKVRDLTKSKTQCDSSEVISLLRDRRKKPGLQKDPNKFTSQALTKSGTHKCRIPVKCRCKSIEKSHPSSPSYLSKLSYFSSEEIQLVHGIRGSVVEDILKQEQCMLCDKFMSNCTRESLRAPLIANNCKYCGKIISKCFCSKWKNESRRNNSISTIPREKLRCICEKEITRQDSSLIGIIEEIRPRSQSISTPSFVKRPLTPKSTEISDSMSKEISRYVKGGESYEIETENMKAKNENKLSDSGKTRYRKAKLSNLRSPPSTTKNPSSSEIMENGSGELKPYKTLEEITINGNRQISVKPHEIRKLEMRKTSGCKTRGKKKSEIPEADLLSENNKTNQRSATKKGSANNAYETNNPEKIHEIVDIGNPSKGTRVIEKVESRDLKDADRLAVLRQMEKDMLANNRITVISEHQAYEKIANTPRLSNPHQRKSDNFENFGLPEVFCHEGDKKYANVQQTGTESQSIVQKYVGQNPDIREQPEHEASKNTLEPAVRTKFVAEKFGKTKNFKDLKLPEDEKNCPPQHLEVDSGIPSSELKNSTNEAYDELIMTENSQGKALSTSNNEFLDTSEGEDHTVQIPDITITIEISDESENVKYAIEGKKNNLDVKWDEINGDNGEYSLEEGGDDSGDKKYLIAEKEASCKKINHLVTERTDEDIEYSMKEKEKGGDEENITIAEVEETKEDIYHFQIDKLPIMISQKYNTKHKHCSRIPRRILKNISKVSVPRETNGKQNDHLCNISTSTEKIELTEKAEQCENKSDSQSILYKKCESFIDRTNEIISRIDKNSLRSHQRSHEIKLSRCKAMGCIKRSSTFLCSNNKYDKLNTSIQNTKGCSKYGQRPSTASKIYDHRKPLDSNYETREESSGIQTVERSEEAIIRICQPCSELLPLNSEKMCPREKPSHKDEISQVHHCHTTENVKYFRDKGAGCIKKMSQANPTRCKQCSQTGGTLEQDMIASYVASCSSNAESPPPEQFIIQTLLYQFAGYELSKDNTSPRRRNSLDRSKSPQLRQPSEHAMRSIQVQVGSSCPSKCETAQTVTTFILTDPRTIMQSETIPTVKGKINYICGPDIPGIRTKVAMNINQLTSVDKDGSCISKSDRSNEQCELFKPCNSSIHSNQPSDDIELTEKQKASYKVLKNEKYVFITVTPVQTEPYEPNYYIILSTTDEEAKPKTETKNRKSSKGGTKSKADKSPNLSTTTKNPLDRFRNQMFSLETLKSSDFLDFFEKKTDALQNTKIIGPPSDPDKPTCLAELLQKNTDQEVGIALIDESERKGECCGRKKREYLIGSQKNDSKREDVKKNVENTECVPDTCEYFDELSKEVMDNEDTLKKNVDKECGPGLLEYVKISHENEQKNCRLPNKADTTRTIACGPESCLPQAKPNPIKVDTSTSPCEPQLMKNKGVQCGSDNCNSTPTGRPLNTAAKTIVGATGNDVSTITDESEEEIILQRPEYCDMQVCTNECEKGDVGSQVCIETNHSGPNASDNFSSTIEQVGNSEASEVNPEFYNFSCGSGRIDGIPSKEVVLGESNSYRNDRDYVTEFPVHQNSDKEYIHKECDDKACPEKTTIAVNKHHDKRVSKDAGGPIQHEDSENYQYQKKIVNTKLDDQDVFALKVAMDRFTKVKPNMLNEEE